MILDVQNLSFSYDRKRTIFHDVSFSLDKGEVLSILGTNGAGKSTLLNCIANLLKPKSGTILLNGTPMQTMSMRDIAKVIGYVPQVHLPTYAFTVRDFTVMGRSPYIGAFGSPSKEDYAIADDALRRLLAGERCDVFITADDTTIAPALMPSHDDGYITFAANRMVISAREGVSISSENWKEKLLAPDATFCHKNPYGDPSGYRGVMTLCTNKRAADFPRLFLFGRPQRRSTML